MKTPFASPFVEEERRSRSWGLGSRFQRPFGTWFLQLAGLNRDSESEMRSRSSRGIPELENLEGKESTKLIAMRGSSEAGRCSVKQIIAPPDGIPVHTTEGRLRLPADFSGYLQTSSPTEIPARPSETDSLDDHFVDHTARVVSLARLIRDWNSD
jgi:hypothetical protein